MAVYVYPVAAVGSLLIRQYGEFEINEKTTEFLAKTINVEEATRIFSENVGYYLPLVTVKAVCDVILASLIGRNLYYLFRKLWEILKHLFTLGLKSFIDGIEKCFNCIQQSLKKCTSFHTVCDKARSKISISDVLMALDYIQKVVVCVKTGFCRVIQFELTKYYLEIRGLICALCEKFNINFLKYVPKIDEESNNNENHTNGNLKDEPLKYVYEIPLEQLLHGTKRELQITREIRESNKTTRNERQIYTITIEPGCKEEHVICLTEVGDRDPINIPADLFITIRSKPHPLYIRQGADLIYTKTISYVDSRSDNPLQIPLLDGKTVSVHPGGTININMELAVDGYGLPNPDNNGARGRLLVRFDIQRPTNQIQCDVITTTGTIQESLADQID